MNKRPRHITQMTQLTSADRFSFSIGCLDITRKSEAELIVKVPASTGTLQRVVVNGKVFLQSGSLPQTVRIAPIKYTESHFREVNEIQQSKNYTAVAALLEVAEKYQFEVDSFKRQYYARKGQMMNQIETQ